MEIAFEQTLAKHSIVLSAQQKEQFSRYQELLAEWNEKMNLTAITARDAVYSKHFLDSATPAFFFDFTVVNTLCDVGSGAGFPSIVLKILFPHLQITIVEALNKRLIFLQEVIEQLKLEHVTLVHERAEIYGRANRECFDVVTARAVARLNMLAEFCVPLTKVNGSFIAMKGANGEEEKTKAAEMLKNLGITNITKETFALETTDGVETRTLFFAHKTTPTPIEYPRAFAQIKKDNA